MRCFLFDLVSQMREAASRCNNESESLMYQDLNPGSSSNGIKSGDSVKLNYSMYLLTESAPKTIGTLIGTIDKPKTVKLGDGKELQGIEQGIVGMKKSSSRILIIPPALAYGAAGSSPSIPPNSWLCVEVSVSKVKYADEETLNNPVSLPTQIQSTASTAPSNDGNLVILFIKVCRG